MRTRCRFGVVVLGLAALAWLAGGSGRAEAGPILPGDGDPFILNFDENGNGSVSVNGGPFVPLHGVLSADPTNGGKLALLYTLPEPVVTGDVLIRGASDVTASNPTGLSDGLRFTNPAGNIAGTAAGTLMFYYSDNFDGVTDLADTGFPANLGSANFVFNTETGPEGNNGFTYLPGGNVYNGISDAPVSAAVPEPSSLALLALGGGALAGWRRWRKRRTA
jgi:hypothetical protein